MFSPCLLLVLPCYFSTIMFSIIHIHVFIMFSPWLLWLCMFSPLIILFSPLPHLFSLVIFPLECHRTFVVLVLVLFSTFSPTLSIVYFQDSTWPAFLSPKYFRVQPSSSESNYFPPCPLKLSFSHILPKVNIFYLLRPDSPSHRNIFLSPKYFRVPACYS